MTPMSRATKGWGVGNDARPATTRGWALASALLMGMVMMTVGCVNPLFFDNVAPAANHAPVVINMQPQPSFGRIVVNTGNNCGATETFVAGRLEDADFDQLTATYMMLVPRDDTPSGARFKLFEVVLDPLPEPVEGAFYVLPPFQLDPSNVRLRVGVAELGVQADRPEGQLLELRISDRGFIGEDDTNVPEGAGLFFMSWAIAVTDPEVACEASP
jgi:hypothetical protein